MSLFYNHTCYATTVMILFFLSTCTLTWSFSPLTITRSISNQHHSFVLSSSSSSTTSSSSRLYAAESRDLLEIEIDMPPSNSGLSAQIKLQPILTSSSSSSSSSKLIQIRYKLPFGLDVQPQNGMAVCTKDGPGGEKVGDVLRLTSQWTMGLPRGNGIISTAASFSGAIGWQCTLFDVMKANKWEEVVEALVSNTPQRTDEVVLVFERAIDEE